MAEKRIDDKERFFVFAITEDGELEPVIWFKTLKSARKEAKEWKKKYPSDAPHVFIGERLEV